MMGYGHGYVGYGNMMGGGSLLGGLFGLVIWALLLAGLVLAVIWAVRALSGKHDHYESQPPVAGPAQDEAVAIARRRLAQGEITPEEYEQIIARLVVPSA